MTSLQCAQHTPKNYLESMADNWSPSLTAYHATHYKTTKTHKTIAVTRTFGQDTNRFHVIESALASFTTKASYRLRVNNQLTSEVGFITTSRFKPGYIKAKLLRSALINRQQIHGMLINAVINSSKNISIPNTIITGRGFG